MHSYGLKVCVVVWLVVLMSELSSMGPHHPEICVDNPVKLNKKIEGMRPERLGNNAFLRVNENQ